MEWQQLEYFQVVAKLQHFTRAAEQLSISQPTLSRSIASLEAELGVPLFEREGRSVRLNRYGERFAARAGRALKEIEDGKLELQHLLDPDHGQIHLSFLKSLGLSIVPKLLNEYYEQYPNIRFQLYQSSTQEMLDQLEQGKVDFVLSSMTESRDYISWASLWQEEICVYVPSNHRLAGKQVIEVAELAAERFIALKKGYGLRTITDRLFGQARIQPNIILESEEIMTVLGFVAAGLGVSILPSLPDLKDKGGIRLSIANPACHRTIGLAWKTDSFLSPAAVRFKAYLLQRYTRAGHE